MRGTNRLLNSNSNWTFIALNLPYTRGDSKAQHNQNSQHIPVSRHSEGLNSKEKPQKDIKLRLVCPFVETGFNFLSDRRMGAVISCSGRAFHTVQNYDQTVCKTFECACFVCS